MVIRATRRAGCLKWKKQYLHFSAIWRPWVLVRPGVNWTRDLPLTVKRSTDWTNPAAIEVQSFSGVVVKPVSSEGKGLLKKKKLFLGKWNTKVLVLLADLIKPIYQRKKIEKLTYRTLPLRRSVSKGLTACHLSNLLTLVKCLHQLWKSFINSDWNSLFLQIGKLPVSLSVWFWDKFIVTSKFLKVRGGELLNAVWVYFSNPFLFYNKNIAQKHLSLK